MIEILQLFTVIFGLIAFAFPAYNFIWFWLHSRDGIARKISYMLGAEAVAMATATYFAINSYTNTYNSMSPELAMMIRWAIFSTGLFSSIALVIYTKRVMNEKTVVDSVELLRQDFDQHQEQENIDRTVIIEELGNNNRLLNEILTKLPGQ